MEMFLKRSWEGEWVTTKLDFFLLFLFEEGVILCFMVFLRSWYSMEVF